MKVGLIFFFFVGLKFLFVIGVFSCKDLSVRYYSLCYRFLGKKKKWVLVS